MQKIIVCTDGSFRVRKRKKLYSSGYAFIYMHPDNNIPQIIYGKSSVKSSTAAEIYAIFAAIYYLQMQEIKNCDIEIRCDEESIISILNSKKYENWINAGWKKPSGEIIISSQIIEQWYKLAILLQNCNSNNICFVKSDDKCDNLHRISHLYSKFSMKSQAIDHRYLYVTNECNPYAESVIKSSQIIHLDFYDKFEQLLNMTPWKTPNSIEKKVVNKKYSKSINWFNPNEMKIEYINISDILLTEEIHLKCKEIQFDGILQMLNQGNQIKIPLLIRHISGNKYSLVAGMKTYCAIKILQCCENVPCVITSMDHDTFIEKYL